jgi:hypothetical protein
LESGQWIIPIESDIHGEVVPGAHGNATEGGAAVNRHLGHDPERAVATGHHQMVHPAINRRFGEGGAIIRFEHDGLATERSGRADQPKLLCFPAAMRVMISPGCSGLFVASAICSFFRQCSRVR